MVPYQKQYAPQYRTLAQAPAVVPVPVPVAPPSPVMKAATTVLTLGVTGAAAWVGIRAGMAKGKTAVRAAGWVAGVGAGLLGLATVVNLVSPDTAKTFMIPFSLPAA